MFLCDYLYKLIQKCYNININKPKRIKMSENIENNQEKNKNVVKIEKNSSKRIYFDEKTLKMIEIMSPAYGIDPNTKENEKIGAIVKIAIENLFKSDFLNKIKDF